MTAAQLLTVAQAAGIVLEVQGARLVVDAPAGALTPALRDQLTRQKPALLALLAPPQRFVTLKGGLTLPLPALQLAWHLEDRGFTMTLDEHQQFRIEPGAALTDTDRAAIQRWRLHLAAIVTYEAPACA